MTSNPFFHGNPVVPAQFVGRQRELSRVASRIVNRAQSSAVVGEPRTGKTSVLEYLRAPQPPPALYRGETRRLLFAYLDAQTLGSQFGQVQFWEYALRPLQAQIAALEPDAPLSQAYATCQLNGFGTYVLELLLAQMAEANCCLVVMLDEFDILLHHPVLNRAEFFGSLRSLGTRNYGVLALVIATRRSVDYLNRQTQDLSRKGSPVFNFLYEVTLGPWSDSDVRKVLDSGRDRFTSEDRRFLTAVAGGHPYLLQGVASALWEAYEEGETDPRRRRQQAGQDLYEEAARILGEIWRLWEAPVRQAFAGVGLAHLSLLANQAGHRDADQYSLPALNKLIVAAFTERDLRRFCRDLPVLAPAVDRFAERASLVDTADTLIEYCQKQALLPQLLRAIEEANPNQYRLWKSKVLPLCGQIACLDKEVQALGKQGFLVQDDAVPGGWRVRPLAFLWWLAADLRQAGRSTEAFREWLRAAELDGLLAPDEERHWSQAAQSLRGLLEGGVSALVQASARGG